jgi:hypothetical protein
LARIGEGREGGAASPLSLAAGAVKTKGVERRGWLGGSGVLVSLSSPLLSSLSLSPTRHSAVAPIPFSFVLAYHEAEKKRSHESGVRPTRW